MAAVVSPQEVASWLRSGTEIGGRSFAILRTISELFSSSETEPIGRDLLFYALERRKEFGPSGEILDGLVRTAGLYPYLDETRLNYREAIAYEYHKPLNSDEGFVFHREQAEVYRRLLSGESVVLSAPTSFGKSRIVDAVIASGRYSQITIVVPTLALIDETRRRLAKFNAAYKIITHVTQQAGAKNIFVFTAERTVAYKDFPKIEFFVIDEFYKLGAMKEDETRTIALNHAFYKLKGFGGQFYLLGPSIRQIPEGFEEAFRCYFYPTKFSTVAVEQHRVPGLGNDENRLLNLCKTIEDPTLIFCSSPARVNEVAHLLVDAGIGYSADSMSDASNWVAREIHPDWVFAKALAKGVGIHHGRIPRALGQLVVRAFNESKLRFLICTSTLIEGVNTKAKNVIVFDNSIARQRIDFFTFNNIKGRSGRMFEHFVGRVYLFDDPPQESLPFVEVPVFSQDEGAPDSLLIQLEDEDLTRDAGKRVEQYKGQDILPVPVIRENSGIEPQSQIDLAELIAQNADEFSRRLSWRAFPTFEQLEFACRLIWNHFVKSNRRAGVFSARQLAFKTMQLMRDRDIKVRIASELRPGKYAAKSADEAVERVFQFERTWAGFELPRFLMALSRIQKSVLSRRRRPFGDYGVFSTLVENLFAPPVIMALDEYGIPFQVGMKLIDVLASRDDLDGALDEIRQLDVDALPLSPFERQLVRDAQEAI